MHSDGAPFWLRLDQSMNDGWALDVDHARSRARSRSTATRRAGWSHRIGQARSRTRSSGSRSALVDIAVLATAFGALLCFALVIIGWRRARPGAARVEYESPELVDATNVGPRAGTGVTVVVAVATAVVATIVIHPLTAVPAGLLAALTVRRPRIGRYLPAALVALAAAQIAFYQWRDDYPLDRDWAQHFGAAHLCAFLGVLLLGVGAAWDVWGRRPGPRRRRPRPESAGDGDLPLEEVEEGRGGAVPREPVGVLVGGGAEPGA